MIGPDYWSPGIIVKQLRPGKWGAVVRFHDDGFCDEGSTEGQLQTRYTGPLSGVVDTIKQDAERLGVKWLKHSCVFYHGDGEDPNHTPPDDWRERVNAESTRLEWLPAYMESGG